MVRPGRVFRTHLKNGFSAYSARDLSLHLIEPERPIGCKRSWKPALSLSKGFVTGPQGCGRYATFTFPSRHQAGQNR
jgi:hypothetical protein